MAQKPRSYVVWRGRKPGVYTSWAQAEAQVKGFPGAQFKSFESLGAAQAAFRGTYEEFLKPRAEPGALWKNLPPDQHPNLEFLSVDAACSGNPGRLEYRGVLSPSGARGGVLSPSGARGGRDNRTGQVVFEEGPFEDGTNNVGEFLAIVRALEWCHQRGLYLPIYSDSRVALSWVRQKECKTSLKPTGRNQTLFDLIHQAERWLAEHQPECPVLEWKSNLWGQIPADYGRK